MFRTPGLGRIASACALAVALVGCGGKPPIGMLPGSVTVRDGEMPKPGGITGQALVQRQEIAPFDKLAVDVFGVEALQKREVVVDASGHIGFPLAGTLRAVGLTSEELANELRNALRRNYVRDPQVSVSFIESRGAGTITVEGSVNQPGIYPITEEMTLLKAVALARGTSQDARTEVVLIFRTVDNQNYVGAYDLTAIRRGNYADPMVFARDKIVIDESRSSKLIRDIGPLLAAPLIAVLNQI